MPGTVSTTFVDYVAVVELDAPQPNFLDPQLVETLADAVSSAGSDDRCRAVVLCSTGRHFCAGANFGAGGGIGADRPASARRLYAAAARLFEIPVPVVAALQGAAVGAGLGLACAADFRVATPSTRLHANFTQLGFHPGFALSVSLPQIIGRQRASDLLYSGRRVAGTEALSIGLVDRLVDDGEERAAALEWAAQFAAAAPQAVRSVKRTLRGGDGEAVRAAMQHELTEQSWLWNTDDCRIGLQAAASREQPVFTGQ